MNPLSSLSIAKRLYLVSFLLIAALVGLAVASWVQLGRVGDLAQRTATVRVQQLARIASTELCVTQVMLHLRQAMLVKDAADIRAAGADLISKRKQISKNDDDFLADLPTAEEKESFRRLWLDLQAVTWPVAEENLKLVEEGKRDAAFEMLMAKTIPAFARMQDWLGDARKKQSDVLTMEVNDIEHAAMQTRAQLVALSAGITIGLVAFSWYLANLLRRRIAASQAVAERVRDGDFTVEVRDDERDEFTPLLAALGAMQSSLTKVVGAVRRNAETVASASAEIAQGNNDLSRRTEGQAGALEETAASMEQLGSTVRQNAENARQANQLAMGATEVAEKGGQVVAEVVETMKGINDSSKKIADIISVIDGIAFQTNILALNAAVEAARAGEQGRGFAVVASEVRNLAQRSADAAKEIKDLITTSVERVEQGSTLVDRAGATMSEVVTAIKRVTDLMGDISSASSEQSAGVEQVGEAVRQMDQSTQQNAALVEESSAAADSLREQATQLVNAMAVFRLRHN
ncbi:methyl-accepting chemotaxis protein [Derxia gummosa]|uniref:Methyl-accepting chemotaxis protein n=1 Tax=Derxia gummosa DSM 723 TaxID=1121388 RepID=A0A8B6X5C9_9BURK|nr:methyl-accepting chemotaxis protein [Derxia gummosa]